MKRHVPNIFTCLNLLCGCIALTWIMKGHMTGASYLIFLAAFFDLLDGLSARLLDVHSPFGKELDSLADVVSFGVVPATMLYRFMSETEFYQSMPGGPIKSLVHFIPFLFAICAALRLAKFNIDTKQKTSFLGMPTPSATLFVVALPFLKQHYENSLGQLLGSAPFLLAVTFFLSGMMVSKIPLFALKFGSWSWKENIYQVILLALAVILIFLFSVAAIPFIIILYIVLSVIQHLVSTKKSIDHQ